MDEEYTEINHLSEISPLDKELYDCNNLDINISDEEKGNNECNSLINNNDENDSDYKFCSLSTTENNIEIPNIVYSSSEDPLPSDNDEDLVLSPLSDKEDYDYNNSYNTTLFDDMNGEFMQSKNKITEEEINKLGKKFVEKSGYNLKMRKAVVDDIIEKNKDILLEIVKRQNSLMVRCHECYSIVAKEEVASLIDLSFPLCKKCISHYDVKSYKDYADKSPDIFSKRCSRCNTFKLLWRQIKIYKNGKIITSRQCNYCCLKKHIKDMKKKKTKIYRRNELRNIFLHFYKI